MSKDSLYTKSQYIKKILNTFFPRFLYSLSPKKNVGRKHWKDQNSGDIHGYDNYCVPNIRIPFLINEINNLVGKDSDIIDLGCNCGYILSLLKDTGYKSLAGVDISKSALEYGKNHLNLTGVELTEGSFEEVLPEFISKNKKYELVYSMGATIELVHPSFDIIKAICDISEKFVILSISEWGHSYPRFYEYEFNKHGFFQIRAIRPFDSSLNIQDPVSTESILIFKKV